MLLGPTDFVRIISVLSIAIVLLPATRCTPAQHSHYPSRDSSYPPHRSQPQRSQVTPARRDINVIDEENIDLDYFLLISDAYKTVVRSIKTSIDHSKGELKSRIDLFPKKIISTIDTFTLALDRYNSTVKTDCINNCSAQNCLKLIPNKNEYAKSFDVFANLLMFEFEKSLFSLEKQLLMLENTMNVTKELINIKRGKSLLKKSVVNEMKQWENTTIDKLYDMFHRLWKSTISLVDDLTTLEQREEELEQSMFQEIKDKLQKFACCVKQFDFQFSGFYCN